MLGFLAKAAGALGGFVDSVFSGIDSIHTSEEEKLKIKAIVTAAAADAKLEMARIGEQVIAHQASIIKAEVGEGNWLTASWRPLLMLSFGFVILWAVIAPTLGAQAIDLEGIPDRFWNLMIVGIGGYVGGRTIEKVGPAIAAALKKDGPVK